jgi:hypothetical protein
MGQSLGPQGWAPGTLWLSVKREKESPRSVSYPPLAPSPGFLLRGIRLVEPSRVVAVQEGDSQPSA